MKAIALRLLVGLFLVLVAYLLLWPVPIDPVAWDAPKTTGYTGPYAVNTRLSSLEHMPLAGHIGPESVVQDGLGNLFVSVDGGAILRLDSRGENPEEWANTGGRPAGLAFTSDGNLIVADIYNGLLSISPSKEITVLSDTADGIPIRYANNPVVAADGLIYFSDSSTKFGAKKWGPIRASQLDIMEHGGHGRLLVYDPRDKTTQTLLLGLQFANGVTMSQDQRSVLVCETALYQVTKFHLTGPRAGESEPLITNLPGFPDNITAYQRDRFWIGLPQPRNKPFDNMSDLPFLRKVVQRLPEMLQPQLASYPHLVAIDGKGQVVGDLQDPDGNFPMITGALVTAEFVFVTSASEDALGRLPISALENGS